MNELTTYVAVHDDESFFTAMTNCLNLDNVVYLHLGPRPLTVGTYGTEIIRCMDYEPDYRNLYDFSGFNVLVKHNLIRTPYVNFLQYDHTVEALDPETVILDRLKTNLGMLAFVPAGYDPNNWMLTVPDFHAKFHEALRACGETGDWTHLSLAWWPSTQGHAWRSTYFYNFINWVAPAIPVLADYQFGGHAIERMLTVFCQRTHPAQVEGGLFVHVSADAHGTGALMRGQLDVFQQRDSVFGV